MVGFVEWCRAVGLGVLWSFSGVSDGVGWSCWPQVPHGGFFMASFAWFLYGTNWHRLTEFGVSSLFCV